MKIRRRHLARLAANRDLKVETLNARFQTLGRMNFLHPPLIPSGAPRRLLAMNQKDKAGRAGWQPEYYKICGAFSSAIPRRHRVKARDLVKGNGMAAAKKRLRSPV
jgi:peptide/nickel transport system substrate-binding protein